MLRQSIKDKTLSMIMMKKILFTKPKALVRSRIDVIDNIKSIHVTKTEKKLT